MNLLSILQPMISNWSTPHPLGRRGERAAARYLKRKGYAIVSHSERGALGEIDLVAVDKRTVVFVEVKTRRRLDRGLPEEFVDDDKQRRLSRLALTFMRRHELLEEKGRFDIVSIAWPRDWRRPQIDHIEDAFAPVGFGQMFS